MLLSCVPGDISQPRTTQVTYMLKKIEGWEDQEEPFQVPVGGWHFKSVQLNKNKLIRLVTRPKIDNIINSYVSQFLRKCRCLSAQMAIYRSSYASTYTEAKILTTIIRVL